MRYDKDQPYDDVLPIILGGSDSTKRPDMRKSTVRAYSRYLLKELVGLPGLEYPTKSC